MKDVFIVLGLMFAWALLTVGGGLLMSFFSGDGGDDFPLGAYLTSFIIFLIIVIASVENGYFGL